VTIRASLLRRAGLLVACLFFAGAWATTASAVHCPDGDAAGCSTYGLSGNIRLQVGDGLPIPATLANPAPNGQIFVQPAAKVTQTNGGTNVTKPRKMYLQPDAVRQAARAKNLGVRPFNAAVFQVKTEITFHFPGPYVLKAGGTNQSDPADLAGSAIFSAGRRTGAATVQYCAGDIVAKTPNATGNPFCQDPSDGVVNGLMRYTKTTHQFGGTAQFGEPTKSAFTNALAQGIQTVNVALNGGGGAANCKYDSGANPTCKAIFAFASVAVTGAQGGTMGFANSTPGGTPTPNVGRIFMSVDPLGAITVVVGPTNTTAPKSGLPNAATSFGGPWTTGRLKVSVTQAIPPNPLEIFTITGSDARGADGKGTISLVSGAMANREVTGPNSNRGWLNFCVGAPIGATGPDGCSQFTVPTLRSHGLVALMGLLALAGGYLLRRRLSGASS
jgi:hypothetical protein